jgi:outer membrane protein OmpA-like peptidoglycan-associated protein
MAFGKATNNESNWMSFSDIMTGLMVIFMFIAISYILQAQNREKEINKIIEEYKETQQSIYKDLDSTFTQKFKDYNLVVNPDLSIQITDANALFPAQNYDQDINLTARFKDFLKDFTPLFYNIILKKKYRGNISEIRIEGHTAIQSVRDEADKSYYQKMLILSQKRANKVLEFMMYQERFNELGSDEKDFLRFITTSNGLAFGKALDKNGVYKYESGLDINSAKSMRVEFRIVTNSQKVVEEWIKKSM